MPITTTKPATASAFFERRAEYIRESLKQVDDEIALREGVTNMTTSLLNEIAYYKRKRETLQRELRTALFNKGRS